MKLASTLSFALGRSRVLSLSAEGFQKVVGIVTGRTIRGLQLPLMEGETPTGAMVMCV